MLAKYLNEEYKIPTITTHLIELGILGLIILGIGLSGIFQIEAGEIGIVTRYGEVSRVADPGLGYHLPLIEGVIKMDTRIKKDQTKSSAVTKDLQDVEATLALNYSINKEVALQLYKEVGVDYVDTIVSPVLQESFKNYSAQYTAEELIQNRAGCKEATFNKVKERLEPFGITTVDFNIVNLEFSKEFNKAIEAKAIAQQEVEKAKQELEKTKVEAEKKVKEAEAEAEAQRLQQQTLTDLMIKKMYIEKWDGHLPTTATGDSGVLLNLGD